MREIKFRAWDVDEKQWIDIKKMGFEGSRKSNELWYVQARDENEKDLDPPYFPEMGDIELMQYTGLKDKNGREIYEGDILAAKNELGDIITVVEWWHFKWSEGLVRSPFNHLRDRFDFTDEVSYTSEIIGNIHEHPHLMEQS